MKSITPRTWLWVIAVCLTATLFVFVTGRLLASPSEEISKAVSAGGASSVKQANAEEFLDAFSSVLVGVDQKQSTSYVAAAVKMRPDLKDRIVAAAKDIQSEPAGGGADAGDSVSPHRRKCKICCHGHTLTLNCKAAERHLREHPDCTRGACP